MSDSGWGLPRFSLMKEERMGGVRAYMHSLAQSVTEHG